jgi:hypothetical protein
MPITNFDKVELLLPMTGANNGTVFTDYSLRKRVVTRSGSIVTSTAQSKFSAYGSSTSFGTNVSNHLALAASSGFILSGPFIVETYFRASSYNSNNGRLWGIGGGTLAFNSTTGIHIYACVTGSGVAVQYWDGATLITLAAAISLNRWYHIAASGDSNGVRMYLDGVNVSQNANPFVPPSTTPKLRVGDIPDSGSGTSSVFTGFQNDLCVRKGEAYTTNFAPPARMTQRTLTRANTGTDSHEYDRAVLFDWNGSQNTVGHTGGGFVVPDAQGDFVETGLNDLEYGVAFIKDGCNPICRGPYSVDAD